MEKIKTFTFKTEGEENKKEITVVKVGSLEEVYKKFLVNKQNQKESQAPSGALAIIDVFKKYQLDPVKKKKGRLLIAGGFVRDIMLGQNPKDLDFVSDLSCEEILNLLQKANLPNVKYINITGVSCPVVRIKFNNGEEYEIATFKSSQNWEDKITPGVDASNRDLTINSLLYNPLSGNIIDYNSGLKDIKNKILRFTSPAEKIIKQDPIRMLRFLRFLFKTGFKADPESRDAILKFKELIKEVAPERIKMELEKILFVSNPSEMLKSLDSYNLLAEILPEVEELKRCEQGPPYHLEGNVFKHTLLVTENLPPQSSLRLKWAAIFHDIAKPETRREEIENNKKKVSFLGHDKLGAQKTKLILRRLRFSEREIKEISWLIGKHISILRNTIDRIKQSKNKDKAYQKSIGYFKKMISEFGENMVDDLVNLAIADLKGKISEEVSLEEEISLLEKIYKDTKKELKNKEENNFDLKNIAKLVNGNIIMKTLGLSPGPEVGKVKKQILDEIMSNNKLKSGEDIKKEVEKILKRLKKEIS